MVEVAIALAIALVIITALMSLVLSSLSSAQNSRTLNDATQYTQEGLEIVRSLTKTNNGDYCLGVEVPARLREGEDCVSTPNIMDKYIRTVQVASNGCDGGLKKVVVTTSWQDGKCPTSNKYCQKSVQASCVSNL